MEEPQRFSVSAKRGQIMQPSKPPHFPSRENYSSRQLACSLTSQKDDRDYLWSARPHVIPSSLIRWNPFATGLPLYPSQLDAFLPDATDMFVSPVVQQRPWQIL